jgi:hypothetical protein
MSVYWGGLHNLQSLQDAIEHPGDARWYNTDDGEAFDSYDRARQDVLTTQGVVNAPPGVTLEPKVVSGTVVNNTSGGNGGGDDPDDEYGEFRTLYRRARRYQKLYEEADSGFRETYPNVPLKGDSLKNIQATLSLLESRKQDKLSSTQLKTLQKYSDSLTELRDVVKEMYHTLTGDDIVFHNVVAAASGDDEQTIGGAPTVNDSPKDEPEDVGESPAPPQAAQPQQVQVRTPLPEQPPETPFSLPPATPTRPPFPDFPQPPATPLQT